MAETQVNKNIRYYIIMGLIWAAITYSLVTAVEYFSEGKFEWDVFLIGLPFWAVGGIIFGFIIRAIESHKKKHNDNKQQ